MVLFVCCMTPAHAILPQADIDKTIEKLTLELQLVHGNILYEMEQIDMRRGDFMKKFTKLEDECDITSMVLYSQYENSVFGMAQASHNTYYFINKFRKEQRPLVRWQTGVKNNNSRLIGLRKELQQIHTENMKAETKANLKKALLLCDSIEHEYAKYEKSIEPDLKRFNALVKRINELEKDNQKMIMRVSNLIFVEGNSTFPYIMSRVKRRVEEIAYDLKRHPIMGQKTQISNLAENDDILFWSGITTYVSLAMCIIMLILCKWVIKRPRFRNNKIYMALLTYNLFNILGGILVLMFVEAPGYMIRSVQLGIEFELMVFVMVASQLVRNDRASIIRFLAVYSPAIIFTLVLEVFLVNLTPVTALALLLPYAFIIFILLQLVSMLIKRKTMPALEKKVSLLNLMMMVICLVMTWTGWTVLSIMLYIYWVAVFCAITGIRVLLELLKIQFPTLKKNKLWNYTLHYAIYPLSLIFTVVGCAYWDAHILNVTLVMNHFLDTPFIQIENVCIVTVGDILHISVVGIVLNYAIKMSKVVLLLIDKEYFSSGKAAVAMSIGSLLIWLSYALLITYLLDINQNGIFAAVGGLSVGLGFALRDTFENCFYGITMMIKRARPGDIVECDGIRGTILEMGIISTSIRTEDGPVLALPNRQLFGRTFKNMTRSNCKEIRHIVFDLADSNDMAKVREIILETAKGMPGVVDFDKHYIVMRNFTCGIVRLDYKCWLNSHTYLRTEPAVREAIFKAFRENGIVMAELRTELDARTSSFLMER